MRTDKRALGRELQELLLAEATRDFPGDDVFVEVQVFSRTLVVIETLVRKPGGEQSLFVRLEYRDVEGREWAARKIIRNIRGQPAPPGGGAT